MQLFNKIKEPVILKDSDSLERQLHTLENYLKTAPENIKQFVEKDINLLKYGIQGENNILYELKNSHMPMYVLHDLHFEIDEYQAQIDFLVITNKLIFVLECKNLYGNIEVNEQGDFVRTLQFGKRYQKEGIYSPLTQNQHHMEVLKKIRLLKKTNLLSKSLFNKNFDKNYKSVVVLANPKTYLELRHAPQNIKNQIIRYDQLIRYIKEENEKSNNDNSSDNMMKEQAEFFARMHKEKDIDYLERYSYLCSDTEVQDSTDNNMEQDSEEQIGEGQAIESEILRQKLKDYRLKKSQEEGIKPYYIYNNLQMDSIIERMPKNLEELMKVKGIAEKKCEKYGEDIIRIINANKV